jgi:hypothetical protein
MSAREAELLEDEVRTLQARLGELEEDLRRTKLDAYQVALERDTLRGAVPVAELRGLLELRAKYWADAADGDMDDATDAMFRLIERVAAEERR